MIGITLQRRRYEIIQELGNNEIKATYLAEDHYLPITPKPLCIIKRFQPLKLDPLRQKAEVLYKLGKSYDQIPNIYDFFDENLEFYLVEEHIEGHDLSEEITRRRQWSEAEVVRFLQEILDVLAYVHQEGIIHWNIKPSNIRRRDSDGKLFLIDFGIAQEIISKGNFLQKMLIGTSVGTSGYMPKEQTKGNTEVWSDIYAVGMTALEALTGVQPDQLPIDRKTQEVIWRDRADVNERLAEVLTKMVQYDFRQRYQSAAEALQALTQAVQSSSQVPLPQLVEIGDKYGSIDQTPTEQVVIPPQFDWTDSSAEELAVVKIGDKYGYSDQTGQIIVEPQFEWACSFSEGLAAVMIGDKWDYKWGYIDSSGEVVIPPRFDQVYSFSEGLTAVRIGDKWRYIDSSGEIVIWSEFDEANSFSEGWAEVKIDGKYGYIDENGQELIPTRFDYIDSFSEGRAKVIVNGKYGYIDQNGQELIPTRFDYIDSFSEGRAKVIINDKYGYIDENGQELIPTRFDYIDSFSEGRAKVIVNGKCGYIDEKGQEVIPIRFDSIDHFSEELAAVKIGSKWGYIDENGKQVIPPKFSVAQKFSKGRAQVWVGGQICHIDKTGKFID
jgi:serine/threonine-protein kinase